MVTVSLSELKSVDPVLNIYSYPRKSGQGSSGAGSIPESVAQRLQLLSLYPKGSQNIKIKENSERKKAQP
jgi:hypothetical protein